MEGQRLHDRRNRDVWALARRQHWVITRQRLLSLSFGAREIERRITAGRLHPVHAGVYAVGRRELSRRGEMMAAVLACGEGAVLSHRSAAELWGIGPPMPLEVTVPSTRNPRRPGIRIHRRAVEPKHIAHQDAIPVTTPALTLVDLTPRLPKDDVEKAVNEADRLDLIDPERLRREVEAMRGMRGAPRLRHILDRRTFTLTQSTLERLFKAISHRAGLPTPVTQEKLNGYWVDFWWPDLGLVIETDGLKYHRTPAQQARAYRRDRAYLAAGLTPLRFSHEEVKYDPAMVEAELRRTLKRLA